MESINDSMNISLSKLWEILKGQGSLASSNLWGCRVRLRDRTTAISTLHTFNVEDTDQSLVGELNPTYHGATKPGCLNY